MRHKTTYLVALTERFRSTYLLTAAASHGNLQPAKLRDVLDGVCERAGCARRVP